MRISTSPLLSSSRSFAAPDSARAGGMAHVAEIVTFRLKGDADPQGFATAAQGMTAFLDSTGAVLSRTLSRNEDGNWTDHIVWSSLGAAQSVAQRIMQEPAAAPFMAMIDEASVTLTHAPIHFRQG